MNKKIKEINITAFRAYKDKQKFDFTRKVDGSIADLVAIYAPNGYGKTSFFDAVEWAITGKIDRLDSGKPIKDEVKIETKHILKNRDADVDCGNVTIISEDDSVISINTKKKIRNMKHDFKEGDRVTTSYNLQFIIDEKESFCTTNLLAHDKITGFLQKYTAEDKTNELRVMWDENNYSEIQKEISDIYNELDKRRKQLTADIQKEEKELKNYKYENIQSDKTVALLLEYETKYNKKCLNGNSLDAENMLLLFDQIHVDSQNEIDEKEKSYNESELLLEEYSEYEESRDTVAALKQMKAEYDKAIKTWDKIEIIEKEQKKLVKEIEGYVKLSGKIEEYYNYVDNLNTNNIGLRKLEKEKLNYQKEQLSINENRQKLNKKLEIFEKEIKTWEEDLLELKRDYAEYRDSVSKRAKYERLNKKAEYILEERDKKLQQWSLYIDQIDSFLSGKLGIGLLYDILPKEIFVKHNTITKLEKEKKLLLENDKVLEKSKKNIVELYDRIQQLSIKGRDIVIEKTLSECPLCHMEYQNHEVLLDKIDIATEENHELEKIDDQILKNRMRELTIDDELKKLIDEVKSEVLAMKKGLCENCLTESIKIKRLQKIVENRKQVLDKLIESHNRIKEKYRIKDFDISVDEQVLNRELTINNSIDGVKTEVEKLKEETAKDDTREKELLQLIHVCEVKILEVNAQNDEILKNNLYIEVKENLESKEFYDSQYDYIKMQSLIDLEYKHLLNEKNILDKQNEKLHTEIQYSRDEYYIKSNECKKSIDEHQITISKYVLRCKKLVGDYVDIELSLLEKLKYAHEKIKNDITFVNERIQKETAIIVGLNALKEQKMWTRKKQSIETNKKKRTLLDSRIKKLQGTKDYVEEYIVAKTNEYFNSDIINQIYNKIDPHPTMKQIRFMTKREGGTLKTHIYAYDETANNEMSPVVYLSSAQVNILSLCIFLSKVLSEKNTTFNTIFIDDPIQHLDGINLLSFIDVLRTITTDLGRQIVISTHNEQFYRLLKVKMDERYYSSKFIELAGTGIIKS